MSQTVFGAQAVVTMLNRAFNNTSPANAVFNNQVATAGSTEASQTAFALQFGNSFAGLTDAQLSTRVLGNLGVLPNAELEAAVTQYFADNGLANRGLVVLQLGQILSTLETAPAPQNIFNDAAKAWNTEVEKSFIYSSSTSSTTPYVGDFAPTPVDQGQTFTLTTGVDAPVGTGGNDTFSGVVTMKAGPAVDGTASTLTLADTIDGGAGVDTLKVSVDNTAAAGVLPAASITGVENIYIKQLDAANPGTYNLSSISGEAKVIDNGSVGDTTFTNIDKATVGAQDITGAAANHTFTFKDSAFASTAALNLDVSSVGNRVTNAVQTLTIGTASAAGASTSVEISATGSNFVKLAAGGTAVAANNGIKSLKVTGAGSLKLDATSALDGGGTLAANLTTVDLSGNTGGVTMQVDKTTVVVTGGAGADVISVGGAMTSGAKFNLGAGNDQLLKAGGSIDANVVVDGGEGVDTVDNGLITVANGGVFKNFEKIALGSAVTTDVELLTGSTISSLLINANAAAVVQNVASGTTIDVTSTTGASDVTVGVKGAAASTADKLTVNFDGAAQAATPAAANIKAGNLVAAKVETIDVVSGGASNTWNSLQVKGADGLQTMTITGAQNLDLTFSGTTGTNVGTAGGAVKSIDGSAATGKLNIDLTGVTYDDKVGFTLKGGTGGDTITTNASSATLTGGGGNDKFVVTATLAGSGDATTAKVTTITDFNAGDSIALAALTGLTKTQTDIAAATNLTQAVNLALGNASVTAGKAAWFQYSGNTYVVVEDATDGFGGATTNDVIVKLTGLVDLTNASVAANALTLV